MENKNEIVSKLEEIKKIIDQNDLLETKTSVFEKILQVNNIFVIIFDKQLNILYQNFPSMVNASHLSNFIFLIGRENYQKIQHLLEYSPKNGLIFRRKGLNFKFDQIMVKYWSVQISSSNEISQEDINKTDVLDEIKHDFEQFNSLSETLAKIRNMGHGESYEILMNEIKTVHLPQITKIKEKIDDPVLKTCLTIIEQNISEILNLETGIDASLYTLLTPSEIQIAKFIRTGKTTKEIANTLSIAAKTVENHRNSLRNKLGITNKNINLRTYLSSLNRK
jgi:DNA-binding CsgD family transcriptional regulator